MPEDIKSLIEKIQQEGIAQAEKKAREIEEQARKKANEILANAQAGAEKVIEQAKADMAKEEQKQKALLSQAARDFLLTLRKEINAVLEKVIQQQISGDLGPENLLKIISDIIKEQPKSAQDIIIGLNKADLERLETHFTGRLKEELKKGIILKPALDLAKGFIISFDGGKSQFDFSDKALAEYIGSYIKPKLGELLKTI